MAKSPRAYQALFRGSSGRGQLLSHLLRRSCCEVEVVGRQAELFELLVGEPAGGRRLDVDLDLNRQRRGRWFPGLTSGFRDVEPERRRCQ